MIDPVTNKNYPEVKSIKIKGGDTYEGFIVNKKMNGKGIYHYDSGDAYFGEWMDNKFHGKGIFCFKNGER